MLWAADARLLSSRARFVAQLRLTRPALVAFVERGAMELFRAEKVATADDQSNHDCRFCAGKLTLLKTIVESESGVVVHMFECRQCGERVWTD